MYNTTLIYNLNRSEKSKGICGTPGMVQTEEQTEDIDTHSGLNLLIHASQHIQFTRELNSAALLGKH